VSASAVQSPQMKSLVRFVLVLGSLIALGACGEDEKDPLATVDGFCESWALRACSDDIEEDCAVDEDECEAAQKNYCEKLVKEGKYDRSGADACLDDVRDAYLDGKLTAKERDIVLYLGGSCALVQNGNGDPGDDCEADSDCDRDQDLVCIIRLGEPEGTCGEARVVSGGKSCSDPDEICDEGFYCNGENCIALPEEDKACSEAIPCGEGFRCMPEVVDEEPSICRPQLEAGDPGCESDDDCITNICLKDNDESFCVKTISFRATDEICDLYQD